MSPVPSDDLFPHTRLGMTIAPGATILGDFALKWAEKLIAHIHHIDSVAPFRHMVTPGGKTMSVAMMNCGQSGWITDRQGYRYSSCDPETGMNWPPLPELFATLAGDAAALAGYQDFIPDSCLINRYQPGSRLTLHQDKDETDLQAPIISFSLGLPARFLWGGLQRHDRIKRFTLLHGDVVVWGGASRLAFHGVDTIQAGHHPLTGAFRYNLTFRKVR